MKLIHTDEKDERFLNLVEELDYGYYQRIEMNWKNTSNITNLKTLIS